MASKKGILKQTGKTKVVNMPKVPKAPRMSHK